MSLMRVMRLVGDGVVLVGVMMLVGVGLVGVTLVVVGARGLVGDAVRGLFGDGVNMMWAVGCGIKLVGDRANWENFCSVNGLGSIPASSIAINCSVPALSITA